MKMLLLAKKTVFLKGMQCFLQDAMQGNTTKEIKSDGWLLMQDLGHRQNYSCQKGVQWYYLLPCCCILYYGWMLIKIKSSSCISALHIKYFFPSFDLRESQTIPKCYVRTNYCARKVFYSQNERKLYVSIKVKCYLGVRLLHQLREGQYVLF